MPVAVRDQAAQSLGLDIGSCSLKHVLIRNFAGRTQIESAGAIDLPQDLVSHGVVVDCGGFARVLSDHFDVRSYRTAGACFSIPSSLSVMRWLSLPPLQGEELREAARFKVKRHLPFPVSDAYLEVSQAAGEEDGLLPSLVIAVKRQVVDSRAEAISQAGLMPIRAELEAQAILRVVERQLMKRSVLWRDASLTIIDVGGNNTHMYVVQNQRLQFIRGVKFGAEMFVAALASGLGIPIHEAAKQLGHPETSLSLDGVVTVTTDAGPATVDLSREVDKLMREFLRLLRYFRSLHPERSYAGILDHVIACGGLVGLTGFCECIACRLSLRVEQARPITGMMARFDHEAFEAVAGRQEAFTVATGLAISGIGHADGGKVSREGEEFAWTRVA